MMMRRPVRFLIACAIAVALPNAGGAQTVAGIVRDSATRAPIPGAVVEVLDASSDVISRVITNERGQYRALFPATARRLHVLRMGFRPQWIVAAEGQRDIVMVAIPTLLQAVSVWDQAQCPVRSDRAHALALWEQASAALLATVVAREANPAFVKRLSYYRIVGERRPMVLSQVVRVDSAVTDRPFVAVRDAAAYIRDGFLSVKDGKGWFEAPDADVLLDDAFPRGYCFRLARPDRARPTHVGLAFEPLRKRSGRIDIDGTLWIDSVARSLSELTFRYTGLSPAEEKLEPGGKLTFRTMTNGLPVIDTWVLQLASPRSARDTAWMGVTVGRALGQTQVTGDLEVHEVGGVLASARWPDSTVWHAALGGVQGRLLLHGQAIPGTEVTLVGTGYKARSDSEGRYRITDLLPGRYVFSLPDSALNAVGYELTHGQTFEVRGGSTTIADVILPTDSSLIAAKCRGDQNKAMMVAAGRVLTSAGEPAHSANLQVFRLTTTGGRERKTDGLGFTGSAGTFFSVFDGAGGASGKFWLCDVAPNTHYVVDARKDGEQGLGSFVTRTSGKRRYTVTIFLDPPKIPDKP